MTDASGVREAGSGEAEERAARAALAERPGDPAAHRALSRALYRLGRTEEANTEANAAILAASRMPDVVAAIGHLTAGRIREAEAMTRRRLAAQPDDALALMMLGDIAARLSIHDQAEAHFREALTIAPSFEDARLQLADTLHAQGRSPEALATYDEALARNPACASALHHKIRILTEIGEYQAAIAVHEALLVLAPEDPAALLSYGNTLRTVGRAGDAALAYRRALASDPGFTEAWWGLSNLKTRELDAQDMARIEQSIAADTSGSQRMYLHFALGKALEDARDHEAAFRHYDAGNRERLARVPHDPQAINDAVDRAITFFDKDFYAAREGYGTATGDPIFILGMTRAGSTLLEQILASHSQIEGTAELPEIPAMVRRVLAEQWRDVAARYPELLAKMDRDAITALGEQYLARAARYRKDRRPFFIDKLPINWMHVGLIHLILPNATIIDARREPMACCFANFKQLFARGQTFSSDLGHIGHFYSSYVRLLDHYDTVLPGRVIRVQHEDLLEDPEREVRRLLDRMGLPFEPDCLRFHENARPVRTPSAEQVRRPISRDAVELWRNYEPWLGPLKAALGPLAR